MTFCLGIPGDSPVPYVHNNKHIEHMCFQDPRRGAGRGGSRDFMTFDFELIAKNLKSGNSN